MDALVSRLTEGEGGVRERVRAMTPRERNRFSPPALSYLSDPALCREPEDILTGDGAAYYREIWRTLTETEEE